MRPSGILSNTYRDSNGKEKLTKLAQEASGRSSADTPHPTFELFSQGWAEHSLL